MKRIMAITLALAMLSGCGAKVEKAKGEETGTSRFVTLEQTLTWRVVADRETKVMYAVSMGMYNIGNFTVLVDADGKPLLWEGEE